MTQIRTIGGADQLVASVQVATLTPGLYAFTRGPLAEPLREVQGLRVPAVQIAAAPSVDSRIELLDGGAGGWLLAPGETLVVRATGPAPRLVVTSYRTADQPAGKVPMRLQRLDGPEAAALVAIDTAQGAGTAPFDYLLHLRNLGDQATRTDGWAGGNEVIEGFALRPPHGLPAEAIEYRVQGADGIVANWRPGGQFAGTRGAGLALHGFAARLVAPYDRQFTLRYAGMFARGGASAAASDGAECASSVPRDPLLAIRFELVPKSAPVASKPVTLEAKANAKAKTKAAPAKPAAKTPVKKTVAAKKVPAGKTAKARKTTATKKKKR